MWRMVREEWGGGGGSGGGGGGGSAASGGKGAGMGAAGEDPHAWLDQHGGAEDVFTD